MADTVVDMAWLGEGLRFEGGSPGGPMGALDGDGVAAPSPMQTLLLALAGCTAADVVDILQKMRVGMDSLHLRIEGDRVEEPPRRYRALRLRYRVTGLEAGDEEKLRRAVALSHDKYCSVLHTFRTDITVETEIAFG